ncbi:DUF5994 family protein [Nocardioides bizhenqiangii]|uniref:DUF5994 family protein n=1 Tax=Nocardioides bizhenqiangii TaxID=3095076 RepID=A0ABZ0ZS22_9ACTN|nr:MULTISPECIES: DUF5994 family protein [unclassified Nocardioides]MDZ5622858.1 DUF5994 family protein [Nocardioides sp. HM23]WQQ27116.1 DUF5994 family protein [Nocardioides sp. HM61]
MSGLRLAIGTSGVGRDSLDGGWWPRSRDLATEFAELVDDFPTQYGRIVRAVYSPPDWDDAPRRIAVRGRSVKVGKFPRDDTHVIYLTTSDRVVYCLLVVPSSFDEAQGSEALLASSTPGNHHSATSLLQVVTNELPVDPAGEWAVESAR